MDIEFVRDGTARGGTCTLRVNVDGKPATVGQAMRLLATSTFSTPFAEAILQAQEHARTGDAEGVFFECVPVSADTVETMPFECAIITTHLFDGCKENSRPFRRHLKNSGTVAVFQNIGRDATLVCPVHRDSDHGPFGHLTEFLKNSTPYQRRVFWNTVGQTYLEIIELRGSQLTYLSTSGTGVAYLHMRIDERSKYFHYPPYML